MTEPADGEVGFMEIGGGAGAAATREFFGAVFGWPSHDDAWLQAGPIRAGTHGDDPAPQIYVFFNVADLAAAAARVRAAGGTAAEPVDEPGFGRFVNCREPSGIQFGLRQRTP